MYLTLVKDNKEPKVINLGLKTRKIGNTIANGAIMALGGAIAGVRAIGDIRKKVKITLKEPPEEITKPIKAWVPNQKIEKLMKAHASGNWKILMVRGQEIRLSDSTYASKEAVVKEIKSRLMLEDGNLKTRFIVFQKENDETTIFQSFTVLDI